MAETVAPARPYSRRLGRVMSLGLLVGACGFAYWLGQSSPDKPSIGGLVVEQKDLDLGDVWESDNFAHTLLIKNPTQEAITIEGFASSCNCVSVTPPTVRL